MAAGSVNFKTVWVRPGCWLCRRAGCPLQVVRYLKSFAAAKGVPVERGTVRTVTRGWSGWVVEAEGPDGATTWFAADNVVTPTPATTAELS